MGCTGCTINKEKNGKPNGCRSNGGCATGGCNRLNTFDWLSSMDIVDTDPFDIVEVSFKNGARKGFYRVPDYYRPNTGDQVVVETGNGYDIGKISLSGELVRLQMRKKKIEIDQVVQGIVRKANERDLDRLQEARDQEKRTMVRARVIARTLDLDMKIGDVEFQGDKRKATFYYTADGRVDFRELIRHFAKEFRVKIEMRQIGARQESARIGGLGSCGRELCCSTWLTDFKSVSTAAARYQNLAINQAKLSGQCGRLKCCLNYELDTYIEALDFLPKNVDKLHTTAGIANLIKTDIFKKVMYYVYDHDGARGNIYALDAQRVREIREMNKAGEKPLELNEMAILGEGEDKIMDYEDVTGVIELPPEVKQRRKKKKRRGGRKNTANTSKQVPNKHQSSPEKEGDNKNTSNKAPGNRNNRRRNRGKRRKDNQ